MKHEEKIKWMINWCFENKLRLELEGECGFGRECVGVMHNECYPDYAWYSDCYTEQLDQNGDVWTPKDAYHKHECVAVLGRGEDAESQLYDWLKWFDDNNFKVETGQVDGVTDPFLIMLGQHQFQRMVKQ